MHERMISMNEKTEYLHRQERTELKPYEDPEWQANNLASALLMPKPALAALKKKLGRSLTAHDLMGAFTVSYAAAQARLSNIQK